MTTIRVHPRKPGRPRRKLRGFNNLTKSLTFNIYIYNICYAKSAADRREYLAYVDETYNAMRLEQILRGLAKRIGATILNISSQDYEPMGASVAVLIAEGPLAFGPSIRLAHLDKSHLCVHTYPETDKRTGVSTFRVDIDVSTCGKISPLRALNYLIRAFNSDVVLVDHRVRGFTRTVKGQKLFIDHKIHSIQQFIAPAIQHWYERVDINISQENIFHTKMLLKDFALNHYLFGTTAKDLTPKERRRVKDILKREMMEIFYAKHLF